MKKEDVPQQGGLNAGAREVSYAVDHDGHYTLESSVGWEAKNIALSQAWEEVDDQLRVVLSEIRAGQKSPLAYYMTKNQMDTALLSEYSGVARWRVKRHLKPVIFAKLNRVALTPYAELFNVTVDQLHLVPDEPILSLAELHRPEEENS